MAINLLILLIIANGAPIIVRHLFGTRFNWPIDGGRKTAAGQYWLGPSKTWRGIVAGVLFTAISAPFLGIPFLHGAVIGALAMTGDLLASFSKRRMGLAPSSRALGLDQIPESLLPLLIFSKTYTMGWLTVLTLVAVFTVTELLLSQALFLLGIRRRPY